jgi:hypothetical protein
MDDNKRLFLILVIAVPVILLLLYIARFGNSNIREERYEFNNEMAPPQPKYTNDAVREYI